MARFSPRLWFTGHGPVVRRTTEHPALYAGVRVAMQRSGTDATKNTCAADREIGLISGQRRYLFVVQADGKARLMAGNTQHLPGRACSCGAFKQPKLQPWSVGDAFLPCFSSQKDWKSGCCVKGAPGGGGED